MSLYTAMRAGVSGLNANASAMAMISDNIANVNTTGYKRGQSDFSAMLNAQSGGATFNAGGVFMSSRRLVDMQGSLEQATSSTDLAINGNGFFVVSNDPSQAQGAGAGLFTRAGAFSLDKDGRMVNAQGFYLMGTPIDPDSLDATAPSSLAAMQLVDLSSVGARAEATENLTISANLDARRLQYNDPSIIPAPPAYTAGAMANGTQTPMLQRAVEIFDSLGAVRTLNLSFLKTSSPLNQWAMEIHYNDPVAGPQLLAHGTVDFDSNGAVAAINSPNPALDLESFTIQWTDPLAPAGTGAADQPIAFDLRSGLTQFAIESSLSSATADGSPPGDLTGVSMNREGILSAQFSNGRIQPLYLIPLATFLNPNGLAAETGGVYRQSIESGLMTLNSAGAGGAGMIEANRLEASNVDLGAEFTQLITTQRAYSASSRVITTADEMLEELIRIKR
jgi:flagellar hook protein FlgE